MAGLFLMAMLVAVIGFGTSQAEAHATGHVASNASMVVGQPAAEPAVAELRAHLPEIAQHLHLLCGVDCGDPGCNGACGACVHVLAVIPATAEPVRHARRLVLPHFTGTLNRAPDGISRPPKSFI